MEEDIPEHYRCQNTEEIGYQAADHRVARILNIHAAEVHRRRAETAGPAGKEVRQG